jgi:hypothetical protein
MGCSGGIIQKRRLIMKLTPPKNVTFWISVFLGVYGIVGTYAAELPYAGLALVAGFVLLALGNLLKGL